MLRSNQGRGPQLPRVRSRARERQLLKPNALEPLLHDQRGHGAQPGLPTREKQERAEQPRPGTARSKYRSEQANK